MYCHTAGPDSICSAAQIYCNENILGPLCGEYNPYYILEPSSDPYPPALEPYLSLPSVVTAIGAESPWSMINLEVLLHFQDTGDWIRSSRRYLEQVIDHESGVNVFIYAGDAVSLD